MTKVLIMVQDMNCRKELEIRRFLGVTNWTLTTRMCHTEDVWNHLDHFLGLILDSDIHCGYIGKENCVWLNEGSISSTNCQFKTLHGMV